MRPIASPSSTNERAAKDARDLDDLGHPRGDVVEISREHAHFVAVAVHLDPRPVELPLDRRRSGRGQGFGDGGRARGEHRLHRPQHLEADVDQRRLAHGERAAGGVGEVSSQHRRPADRRGRNGGGLGDRVGHQPRERTLAELTREQAHDEVGLGRRRAREQVAEDLLARAARSRAGGDGDPVERLVELGDGHAVLLRIRVLRIRSRIGSAGSTPMRARPPCALRKASPSRRRYALGAARR